VDTAVPAPLILLRLPPEAGAWNRVSPDAAAPMVPRLTLVTDVRVKFCAKAGVLAKSITSARISALALISIAPA
jgi:hypothetical protein